LLRLQPLRSLAYRLIDADIFRHALEERLKHRYVTLKPFAGAPDRPSAPVVLAAVPPARAPFDEPPDSISRPVPSSARQAGGSGRP
jgi:hypothetical protein